MLFKVDVVQQHNIQFEMYVAATATYTKSLYE